MKIPLEIHFSDMPPSEATEAYVRERAAKLDKFSRRVVACRVAIAAPHRHQRKGRLYNVRIDLTVPGKEIVVSRSPSADASHADVYVAARDAFRVVQRQLQDVGQRRSKNRAAHAEEVTLRGKVVRLESDRGIGYIADGDGTEVFFHRNAVRDNG
ncbi:MAG: HPF/RaiA family ribosome-associated protein [Alphaproteobacteria bacterium]|nr:HPF/RaiA family ribosome-associated protein [Alphaproteobacteria bacterium]